MWNSVLELKLKRRMRTDVPPQIDQVVVNASKNAVVTVCIGDYANKMAAITHSRIAAYAARVGADFLVLRSVHPLGPFYTRFQIRELLESFQRLIYVDTDVIVAADCPNLFEKVSEEKFGAYDEGRDQSREGVIRKVQESCGDIGWRQGYINTGVMVISRLHRDVFDLRRGNYQGDEYYEQTQTNYNLQSLKIPIHDLGRSFNCFAASLREDRLRISPSRFRAYMVHYAGLPGMPGRRMALMHRDERIFRMIETGLLPKSMAVAVSYVMEGMRRGLS
jgi:nitrite reductase/ring-hydroxylating ferredoxin subunit